MNAQFNLLSDQSSLSSELNLFLLNGDSRCVIFIETMLIPGVSVLVLGYHQSREKIPQCKKKCWLKRMQKLNFVLFSDLHTKNFGLN